MAKKKSVWQEMTDWVEEVSQTVGAELNEGLNEAADFMAEKFIESTPVGEDVDRKGTTKSSWVVEKKYNNVKYINNTAENNKRIPIVNLLEYAKNGKPFVRKAFQANQEAAMNIIKAKLEKGGDI